MQRSRALWAGIAAGVFAVIPLLTRDTFALRVVTEAMMWIGLAVAWDVLGGYTGYLNFGHGAFFGLGAYTTAVLMMRGHWPFALALVAGGVTAGAAAVVAGLPTLRLKGAYFAIATWALSRAVQQLALVLEFTGGPDGMRLPPFLNPMFFYYLMWALVTAIFVVLWILLERSAFGLKLQAIREDEEGAMALGLRPTAIKVQAFVLSTVPAGILGGVYAYWITFIDPASVLGDLVTDQSVVMAVFGGLGTLVGPAVGAVLIYAFKTFFWAYLSEYQVLYLIILGTVIALSVVFLPDGLIGLMARRRIKEPAEPEPADEDSQGLREVAP
ncbi:MAG: branched-chain amino acid ABC transporter permease [Deltaproteobacteria bacterium]|nr:branched-chain amino acid ABC transporter permease [Deltaproteobacteria bacterium]